MHEVGDKERNAIEELYRDALYVATVDGADYALVVFDKTPKGHAQRDLAAERFSKKYGTQFDLEDCVDINVHHDNLSADWAAHADELLNEETYPTFRLPLTIEQKALKKHVPELSVLLDMAHQVPGAKHVSPMELRKRKQEETQPKLRRLKDREDKKIPSPPPELLKSFVIQHIVCGDEMEPMIRNLLLRREREQQIGEKFEQQKLDEHDKRPTKPVVAFDHLDEHLPLEKDGFPNIMAPLNRLAPLDKDKEEAKRLATKVIGKIHDPEKDPDAAKRESAARLS